jgi:hypothetical protein
VLLLRERDVEIASGVDRSATALPAFVVAFDVPGLGALDQDVLAVAELRFGRNFVDGLFAFTIAIDKVGGIRIVGGFTVDAVGIEVAEVIFDSRSRSSATSATSAASRRSCRLFEVLEAFSVSATVEVAEIIFDSRSRRAAASATSGRICGLFEILEVVSATIEITEVVVDRWGRSSAASRSSARTCGRSSSATSSGRRKLGHVIFLCVLVVVHHIDGRGQATVNALDS